jgi:hypothetical protein
VQYQSTEDCWRQIRGTRHDPQGFARERRRKLLYTSSLEQAEQYFRLSDKAGYETKPVLLYYGLNQAARAILAAAARPDEPWETSGHGIKAVALDSVRELGDLVVRDFGSDQTSFRALARHIGSPSLPRGTTMRELWFSLPECFEHSLAGSRNALSVVQVRTPGQDASCPGHGPRAIPCDQRS